MISRWSNRVATSPTLNFLDTAFLEDPYPTFQRLRDESPILWNEDMGSWIVSRYEDCLKILRNAELFPADPRSIGEDLPESRVSIQTLDGSGHAAIQRVLVNAFREVDLFDVRRSTREFLVQAIDNLENDRDLDFVRNLALPVTTATTISVLGLPEESAARIAAASSTIIRSMMHGLIPDGQKVGLRERAHVTSILDQWYGRTREGLLGAISRTSGAAELDRKELLNSVRVVLLAGINSTQRLLSLSLHTLLRHESAFRQFNATPDKNRGIHELVRYEGSAQSAARYCSRTTHINGQKIARGDSVVALLGSANRDERRFPNASQLIFRRHPNPHLGFGRGTHACLGIPVAQAIARAVFEHLATHFPDMSIAGARVVEPNPALRGLISLPIRLF